MKGIKMCINAGMKTDKTLAAQIEKDKEDGGLHANEKIRPFGNMKMKISEYIINGYG